MDRFRDYVRNTSQNIQNSIRNIFHRHSENDGLPQHLQHDYLPTEGRRPRDAPPQLTPPPTPESADDIPLQKGSEPTPSTSNTKPPRGRPPPLYDDICREDLLPTYDKSSEYIKHSLAACVNGKIHPNFGGDYLAYRKRFGGLI